MSEKRFTWKIEKLQHLDDEVIMVVDNENKEWKGHILNIVDLLNEQQATIQRMKHSLNTIYKAFEKHYGYDMRNAVWLIDELNDEIVDELYIAETDSKNRKEASMYWKKKVDEQQATIQSLEEEIKLLKPTNIEQYEQIQKLQEENEQLRKELGDCEKFRYTTFKRMRDVLDE